MADFETIAVTTDPRGVATLTLNRPEKHNAMNAEMISELTQAAKALGTDENVRVVVLASTGKSFCAGGDLGWMQAQASKDRNGKKAEARALAEMLSTLNSLPKLLIARVQGAAYGGGVGMMSVADVVIAVEGTRFGLTETKLGLIPATIGPFVVRRMGEGFARQVFLNSKGFDTDLALRSGLVAKTCTVEDVDVLVEKEVAAVLNCAPGAVAAAKELCLTLGGANVSTFIDHTIEALADRWESPEAEAGIKAFFAREPPHWTA